MNFLLDTNVVSETMRKQPSDIVLNWVAAQIQEALYLSVITLGELRRGALVLAEGKKRRALLHWIETGIEVDFAGRILPVDALVMKYWAQLQADAKRKGCTLPAMNSLLAATARAHDLTLVTGNTADFQSINLPLVNPWHR